MKTFEQWWNERGPHSKKSISVHLQEYEARSAWSACTQQYEQRLKEAEEVIAYYANEMSYSVDSYEGISGEMRSRVVLYGDSDERNEVYSYAGKRAREYQKKHLTKHTAEEAE